MFNIILSYAVKKDADLTDLDLSPLTAHSSVFRSVQMSHHISARQHTDMIQHERLFALSNL